MNDFAVEMNLVRLWIRLEIKGEVTLQDINILILLPERELYRGQ